MTMTVAQKLASDTEPDALELSLVCPTCEHAETRHCSGGKQHSAWRTGNGGPSGTSTTCVTRHCMEPLCSCVGEAQ